MPYTLPTLTQAQAALANRLNDPRNVHWVLPELTVCLTEALRTWNVWTSQWRDRGTIAAVAGQAFYDLSTDLSNSLRAHTITNWDVVASLQYALMEPAAAGGTWTGTDQFTLDQLSTAVQRRRDQFLRETGCVLTRSVIPYVSPAVDGRLTLPESIANVRRAAWMPTPTQFTRPLQRMTEWAGTYFRPSWPSQTTAPRAYSVTATPPLTLQLVPPATTDGNLDLIAIQTGAAIDPTILTPLGIPNDYGWIVKYGALADLLGGDGLALDPQRAQYCEQRWQQGIDRARAATVVVAAMINGTPTRVASLTDADQYSPTWQLVPGVPRQVIIAGQNLLASWPPPGLTGGPWTFTLDVVRNAPVPVAPFDVLQVSQDVYDTILDLAQHIALMKEGPGQTDVAMALLDRAARAAGIDLEFQQASSPDRAAINGQQQQDRRGAAPEQQTPVPMVVES